MKVFTYDSNYYNFVEEVSKVYEIDDLSEIHNQWVDAKKYHLLDKMEEDQSTVYHKQFYNHISKTAFYNIFNAFILGFI